MNRFYFKIDLYDKGRHIFCTSWSTQRVSRLHHIDKNSCSLRRVSFMLIPLNHRQFYVLTLEWCTFSSNLMQMKSLLLNIKTPQRDRNWKKIKTKVQYFGNGESTCLSLRLDFIHYSQRRMLDSRICLTQYTIIPAKFDFMCFYQWSTTNERNNRYFLWKKSLFEYFGAIKVVKLRSVNMGYSSEANRLNGNVETKKKLLVDYKAFGHFANSCSSKTFLVQWLFEKQLLHLKI